MLVQDDRLIVYNTKSSGGNLTENAGDDFENTEETPEPWGYYHVFDLSQTGNEAALMECIESGDDKDKIQGFIEAGSAYEHEHLLDAFDHMAYMQSDEMDDIECIRFRRRRKGSCQERSGLPQQRCSFI